MPGELLTEIRKLEVRLEGYLGEEDVFVKQLKKCLSKLKVLNKDLERLKTVGDPRKCMHAYASRIICPPIHFNRFVV